MKHQHKLDQMRRYISKALTAVICAATILGFVSTTARSYAQTLNWTSPLEYTQFQLGGNEGAGVAAWYPYLYVAMTDNSGSGAIDITYTYDGTDFFPATPINVPYPYTVDTPYNPAIAVFNNELYAAWVDNHGVVTFASSTDGVNFTNVNAGCSSGSLLSARNPSLAVFNGDLYLAFSTNSTLAVCRITSSNQTTVTDYPNIALGLPPALGVFNNTLYVAYIDTTSSHYIYLAESTNGVNFTVSNAATSNHTTTQCSLAVHNGILYIGYRQNSSGNRFYYTYSGDGVTFSGPIEVNWTMGGSPALAVPTLQYPSLSGHIFNVFGQNDTGHYLFTSNAP
ncbi:MAG TPA: hypothetical protein VMU92_07475 [Acidobacteriaceae bacterium]|nr:hypothetical protein [Acidobacteriaceae bacterium]